MSDTSGFSRTSPTAPGAPFNWQMQLPAAALAGVRSRRMVAVCLDFILVSLLVAAISFVLFFLTLGLSLIVLPPLFPFVAFFYNGFTISGWRMATPGMKAMDLEMRLTNGTRVPFLYAAVHAVLFYVSWMFPPVFLISLFTDDKRCLHDIFSGIIVTRRAS
jgi:uncharacterized RDD family membrane protein YckC